MLEVNTKAPGFEISDQDGTSVTLDSYAGNWLVLYFYPKDNTSGCTTEALGFTANKDKFKELGAEIIGVSPDSIKSHCNFIAKHDLTVRLLSDPDHTMLNDYGVWQLKRMYGREYYGVVRSTYIINPEGNVVAGWEKVRVKNHVETVLEKLKELQRS